jgi:hypothetical protein
VPEESKPSRSWVPRALWDVPVGARVIIIVAATAIFCLAAWLSFHRNLDFAWTSVRLAPAFALTSGQPLFSAPETPPWVMVGYGPLYPVAYLPSTVASQPAPAVAIATLLAHLYILVPVALLSMACMQRLREDRAPLRIHPTFLLLLFALVACVAPSLNYITSNVHVDAPALGLFLLAACAVVRNDDGEPRHVARYIIIAGVCAGLSAACKLNLLAASVGFAIWILRSRGFKDTVRFAATAAGIFLFVYAIAALRDGFGAVLLNLRLPGRMPWFTFQGVDNLALAGSSHDALDKFRTALNLLGTYLRDYGIIALALLLLLPTLDAVSARATRMTRLFLLLAGVLLFASIASVGKQGGDVNSRALVTLPLTLAALTAFATLVQQAGRTTLATAYAALAALTFVVALSSAAAFLRSSVKGTATLVEAYDTVAKEPGRWYFPFDPLAHLLGEGKFRPNMDVVHSYAAAGSPVHREAFRGALPEDLQHIAVPPAFASWGIAEIRRLLPEYGRAARELDLEHHNVISR